MEYLRHYVIDTAYLAPQERAESSKAYKRPIYNTMIILPTTTTNPPTMRVLRLWPNTDWTTIWKNLHEAPVPETSKVTWHGVIHDIVPTHDRLHKIQMVPIDLCGLCNKTDTLLHRLTECGEGPTMWEWTRWCLVIILRTDPKYVPNEWLLRPTLKLWPPQRHRAVLWTLVNFVVYRLHQRLTLTPQDYLDILRRKNGRYITQETGHQSWGTI